MVDSDVESPWYEALLEKDCLRVMDLLRVYPTLVEKGWMSEAEWKRARIREGSPSEARFGIPRGWKGRTALHVGAMRGCKSLVDQVVGLYNVNYRSEIQDESLNRLPSNKLYSLLEKRDGFCELNALSIAVLNGSVDVTALLMMGYLSCRGCNPYEITRGVPTSPREDAEQRASLKQIVDEVICSFSGDPIFCMSTCLQELYSKHRSFNFLDRGLYLFHFLLTNSFEEAVDEIGPEILYSSEQVQSTLRRVLNHLWEKVVLFSDSLWRFLLELHDGLGRAPLHVAVDEGTVKRFFETIKSRSEFYKDACNFAMTASDGAGRTALHRFVIIGGSTETAMALQARMNQDLDVGSSLINAACNHSLLNVLQAERGYTFNLNMLCAKMGFQGSKHFLIKEKDYLLGSTPLQSAIIHRRSETLRVLLGGPGDQNNTGLKWPSHLPSRAQFGDDQTIASSTPLELAVFVGEASVARVLLQSGIPQLQRGSRNSWIRIVDPQRGSTEEKWSGLFFAASSGNYEMLDLLLDRGVYDHFEDDSDGNSALHYVMNQNKIAPYTNFLDYVNCEQIISCQEHETKFSSEDLFVKRQACVDLLLQAGCDMFKPNKKNQVPKPGPDLSCNTKFLSWWSTKKAKEFANVQNRLNVAANGVAVTAALVATASYAGPLQPPLENSNESSSQMQNNIFLKFFIVYNALSFYFAIVAIIFSLFPLLHRPKRSMLQELKHTLNMVTIAVDFLFPAIICILVALSSSSIAVASSITGTQVKGFLTIFTSAIGGFVAIFLFFRSIGGLVFVHEKYLKKLHDPRVWSGVWSYSQSISTHPVPHLKNLSRGV